MSDVVRRCTGLAMVDQSIIACHEKQQGISIVVQLSLYVTGQRNYKTCAQSE